jgi:hypothetical protein
LTTSIFFLFSLSLISFRSFSFWHHRQQAYHNNKLCSFNVYVLQDTHINPIEIKWKLHGHLIAMALIQHFLLYQHIREKLFYAILCHETLISLSFSFSLYVFKWKWCVFVCSLWSELKLSTNMKTQIKNKKTLLEKFYWKQGEHIRHSEAIPFVSMMKSKTWMFSVLSLFVGTFKKKVLFFTFKILISNFSTIFVINTIPVSE